ncbi:MAG: type II toxin-antitoxin system HicA family toxin [Candidatus Diapherotrites archaeon]|nr:type II toxin-antitoxin system HicA family toxin [Candidatus Diapherotrites archaeon]
MKLPILSGIKVIKALRKAGFEVDHQTGGHFILRENKAPFRRAIVPNHKIVVPGTLLSILKQAGLSREEFLNLL